MKSIDKNINNIIKTLNKPSVVVIEGYIGLYWENIVSSVKNIAEIEIMNIAKAYKDSSGIDNLVHSFLTNDPLFGKIYTGKVEDFFDKKKLRSLVRELKTIKKTKTVILYGPGSFNKYTKKIANTVIYADIAPEELIQRTRRGEVRPFGYDAKDTKAKLSKNDPGYLSIKRFHYVDFPLLNNHRNHVLGFANYYIDANKKDDIKIVPISLYKQALKNITQAPFRPIPHYDPAPWGGQWLKKARGINNEWPNIGWSYDLIAPDMAVKVPIENDYIEVPFVSIVHERTKDLMGPYVVKRFKQHWPIRINYDDTLGSEVKEHGMGIHVHPPTEYVRSNFKEKWGQQESYYMLATGEGATVYLGLKDGADIEEFRKDAKKAENGIPFDYEKYLNAFPAKEGDLFLIPTGTVHSGKNVVVLEISATTVRYTLRIYDYLRPDLNGKLRHISTKHAFKVIDPTKRTSWIKDNLIQKPVVIRRGDDWKECVVGMHEEIFFRVHRVEFKKEYKDETKDRFHLLTLAKGNRVKIIPEQNSDKIFELGLSETVVIPASVGVYRVISLGGAECHIVKSMVK